MNVFVSSDRAGVALCSVRLLKPGWNQTYKASNWPFYTFLLHSLVGFEAKDCSYINQPCTNFCIYRHIPSYLSAKLSENTISKHRHSYRSLAHLDSLRLLCSTVHFDGHLTLIICNPGEISNNNSIKLSKYDLSMGLLKLLAFNISLLQ